MPVIKFHDIYIPIAGHFVWRILQISILVLSNSPANNWENMKQSFIYSSIIHD